MNQSQQGREKSDAILNSRSWECCPEGGDGAACGFPAGIPRDQLQLPPHISQRISPSLAAPKTSPGTLVPRNPGTSSWNPSLPWSALGRARSSRSCPKPSRATPRGHLICSPHAQQGRNKSHPLSRTSACSRLLPGCVAGTEQGWGCFSSLASSCSRVFPLPAAAPCPVCHAQGSKITPCCSNKPGFLPISQIFTLRHPSRCRVGKLLDLQPSIPELLRNYFYSKRSFQVSPQLPRSWFPAVWIPPAFPGISQILSGLGLQHSWNKM